MGRTGDARLIMIESTSSDMLISIFGTPSALTYWVIHAMRGIMQAALGEYHYIHALTLNDLQNAWSERDERSVLFFADCPNREIVDLIMSSNAPILLVADDPEDLAGFVMRARGMDALTAIRFSSQSYATLAPFFKNERVHRFGSELYGQSVRDVIERLTNLLDGNAGGALIDRAMKALIHANEEATNSVVLDQIRRFFQESEAPGNYFDLHNSQDYQIVSGALSHYTPILSTSRLKDIEWPRGIFADWDRPGRPVEGTIELVGPARFIICGPYMHLPRGLWTAYVEFEVSDNHSGNRLRSDILHGEVLCGITTDLPSKGVFSFELSFEVVEPLLPVEVRFELQRGAIEGKFLLRRVLPAQTRYCFKRSDR